MKQQDPTKFRDPMPQFKFAGGAAIIGVFLLIAEAPIAGLAFLLAIVWLSTALFRYAKIKRWLKQNPPAESQAAAPRSIVSIGDESSDLSIDSPSGPAIPNQDPPILDTPKSNRKLIVVTGVTTLALIAALGFKQINKSPFEAALKECDLTSNEMFPELGVSITDNKKTLLINHKGEEDLFGLTTRELSCVLSALEVPTAIQSQMDSTRAFDGRQSGDWNKLTATWAYHPDSGLDVIVTKK